MKVVLDPETAGIVQNFSDGFSCSPSDNGLCLNLSEASAVEIFNAAGQSVISSVYPEGAHNIFLPSGMYIVNVGNKSTKIRI